MQTSLDGALTAPPEYTPNQPFFVAFEPNFRGGVWVPIPASAPGSADAAEEARKEAVREAARRTEATSRETSRFFRTLALKRDETAPPQPAMTRLRAFEEVPDMSYHDEFLEELVHARPESKAVPAASCTPAVTGGTPMVFAGRDACVSGCFSSEPGGLEQAARMLMLDDQPLVPKAASPTTIVVRVEADTKPGPRTIRWNSFSGGAPGQLPIVVLGLEGTIDRDKLMKGESTTMRLRILGGPQRIALRIVNKTPSIIKVEGGESQVVTTSGGLENVVTREVQGMKKGNFAIDYSLDQPPCGSGR